MLEFKEVFKFTLKNINLKVEKGDFCILCGPGGSGKTTVLRLAYGDICPDKGSVYVLGSSLTATTVNSIRAKIGFIPQEGRLFEEKDVYSNLSFPLKLLNKYEPSLVISTLKKLHLYELKDTKAQHLSSSERQRLKIAQAFAKNPLLILADEPRANLDPGAEKEILALFKNINVLGATVVMATARDPLAYFTESRRAFHTRIITLNKGEIIS